MSEQRFVGEYVILLHLENEKKNQISNVFLKQWEKSKFKCFTYF